MTDSTTSAPSAATAPRRIAVVGLGNMGGPMAANLVKAGHHVTGFDLLPAAVEAAATSGVTVATSGAEAVRDADIVVTMLPAGRHVLSAYSGSDHVEGLLAAAQPGTIFVDSSTIDVADARAAATAATASGPAHSTHRCPAAPSGRPPARSPSWSAPPTRTSPRWPRCCRPWAARWCTAGARAPVRRPRSATT